MHGQRLVAVYPSRNEAEQAFRAARGSGIPSQNIQMSGADLSVLLDGGASDAKIKALEEILRHYRPVNVRVEEEGATMRGPAKKAGLKDEEIIPLPREEPKVSAKVTDRVHHIKTYVVEEPFEKEVSLNDEHLVVERRAASKEGGEILERDYEFHERHEEPVVVMETRAGEELVVRTEHTQHTERVRGKVRRTDAKIEKATDEKIEKASSTSTTARSAPATQAPAAMKGRS
jgi:hypothetical protein